MRSDEIALLSLPCRKRVHRQHSAECPSTSNNAEDESERRMPTLPTGIRKSRRCASKAESFLGRVDPKSHGDPDHCENCRQSGRPDHQFAPIRSVPSQGCEIQPMRNRADICAYSASTCGVLDDFSVLRRDVYLLASRPGVLSQRPKRGEFFGNGPLVNWNVILLASQIRWVAGPCCRDPARQLGWKFALHSALIRVHDQLIGPAAEFVRRTAVKHRQTSFDRRWIVSAKLPIGV